MSDNKINDDCTGRAVVLSDMVEYSAGSVVSKTIVDKEIGTITLFAFDAGQKLSEHQTPFDAVVQVIDGRVELTIGGESVIAKAGQIIIMPANVPHSVTAVEKFKMMLTMIRQN